MKKVKNGRTRGNALDEKDNKDQEMEKEERMQEKVMVKYGILQ